MQNDVLLQIVDLIYYTLFVALLARVLLSWFPAASASPFGRVVFQMTEPILGPIRRVMPRTGMLDFTPIVAFILLQIIHALLRALIQNM